jgi:hypothetical protein
LRYLNYFLSVIRQLVMTLCSLNAQSRAFAEVGFNEERTGYLDQQASTIGNRTKKGRELEPRWVGHGGFALPAISGPARVQSGGPERRLSLEEIEQDPVEPDCEPDVDDLDCDANLFQHISPPTRQMSILSNYSAKGPSRQVTAMSNLSELDWEPAGFKRQQTDECWPTYQAPSGNEQASTLFLSNLVTPSQSTETSNDMRAANASQFGARAKHDDAGDLQFRRKRESLIDLAKQQEEQAARKDGPAPKSAGCKFCPWCGGSVRPSFRFCVFCGNAVPQFP